MEAVGAKLLLTSQLLMTAAVAGDDEREQLVLCGMCFGHHSRVCYPPAGGDPLICFGSSALVAALTLVGRELTCFVAPHLPRDYGFCVNLPQGVRRTDHAFAELVRRTDHAFAELAHLFLRRGGERGGGSCPRRALSLSCTAF